MPHTPDDALAALRAELTELQVRHRRPRAGRARCEVGNDSARPAAADESLDVTDRALDIADRAVATAQERAEAATERQALAERRLAILQAAEAQHDAHFAEIETMAAEFADELDAKTALQDEKLELAKLARETTRDHRREWVRTTVEEIWRSRPDTQEFSISSLARLVVKHGGESFEWTVRTMRNDIAFLIAAGKLQ